MNNEAFPLLYKRFRRFFSRTGKRTGGRENQYGIRRFEVGRTRSFDLPGPPGQEGVGQLANISVSGILFYSAADIKVGDRLSLQIKLESGGLIRCKVHIVRRQMILFGPQAYGAVFYEFAEEDGLLLRETLLAIRRGEWDHADYQAAHSLTL